LHTVAFLGVRFILAFTSSCLIVSKTVTRSGKLHWM
jgi:hypothetical protein